MSRSPPKLICAPVQYHYNFGSLLMQVIIDLNHGTNFYIVLRIAQTLATKFLADLQSSEDWYFNNTVNIKKLL